MSYQQDQEKMCNHELQTTNIIFKRKQLVAPYICQQMSFPTHILL